jgi:hypothetical protein
MTPSFIYLFIFNGLQWHYMPLDLNSLLTHIVFGGNTMNGKNMLEGRTGPITQSVEAVKKLLTFLGRASDPLPNEVRLDGGRLVLVLSNKKDAYYVATSRNCSCPSAVYNPGKPCKHSRKYFPQPKKSGVELEAEGEAIIAANDNTIKRLARPLEDLRASLPGWRGPDGQRANGPVEA